ncbi:MAG: triose-phosphate isomerase [Firmicutes bacterium]|nr:triose-phosphate isomerase [Bacillota bacterium]
MKQKYLILNWKSKVTYDTALNLLDAVKTMADANAKIVVCPPYPILKDAIEWFKGTDIEVGVQDVSALPVGAHTGEVSAELLASMGVKYAIIGHSEVRARHKLKNADVKEKILAAQKAGLIAILCIGEDEKAYKTNKTNAVLKKQLEECIDERVAGETLVVAYEPIWAIGTGHAATPIVASDVIAHIKCITDDMYPFVVVPVIYGGSIKANNIADFIRVANIDGALVGGASVDPDEVLKILGVIEKKS